MPPAGGFEAVKYKRNLPTRGPGAYAILGGVTAICAYGFYRLGLGNLERRYVMVHRLSSIFLHAALHLCFYTFCHVIAPFPARFFYVTGILPFLD